MHISPITPNFQTGNIKNLSHANSVNRISQTKNLHQNSGVILTFTGAEKDIHQFVSYAPENKRYKMRAYNQGGLGVVAQEAPESWRKTQGSDVRDFSPYHSYANGDGGVRVVRLQKKNGKYLDSYPQTSFFFSRTR